MLSVFSPVPGTGTFLGRHGASGDCAAGLAVVQPSSRASQLFDPPPPPGEVTVTPGRGWRRRCVECCTPLTVSEGVTPAPALG